MEVAVSVVIIVRVSSIVVIVVIFAGIVVVKLLLSLLLLVLVLSLQPANKHISLKYYHRVEESALDNSKTAISKFVDLVFRGL